MPTFPCPACPSHFPQAPRCPCRLAGLRDAVAWEKSPRRVCGRDATPPLPTAVLPWPPHLCACVWSSHSPFGRCGLRASPFRCCTLGDICRVRLNAGRRPGGSLGTGRPERFPAWLGEATLVRIVCGRALEAQKVASPRRHPPLGPPWWCRPWPRSSSRRRSLTFIGSSCRADRNSKTTHPPPKRPDPCRRRRSRGSSRARRPPYRIGRRAPLRLAGRRPCRVVRLRVSSYRTLVISVCVAMYEKRV